MKSFFFIIIVLMAAIMTGCSRKQGTAPDYDARPVNTLISAVSQIQGHQTADAINTLQELGTLYPSAGFPSAALRQEQKRITIEKQNELLAKTEFNQLLQLTRQTETEGITAPEILQFSQYRDALDALRLFVAKTPYQTSKVLEQNLRTLTVFKERLNQSPTFEAYYGQQLKTLQSLITKEMRTLVLKAVIAADNELITENPPADARKTLAELEKSFPDNIFSACLVATTPQDFSRHQTTILNDNVAQMAFEVAALTRWSKLPSDTRKTIVMLLGLQPPRSLAGAWLCFQMQPDIPRADQFAKLLQTRQDALPKQFIVKEFLEKHLLPQAHYNAWCWRSPCPGATEIIARIYHVGQRQTNTSK